MRTTTMRLTGVILAGGKSTRMGQDKALMLWSGKTWLAHMQSLLFEAGVDDVIICRDMPINKRAVKDTYTNLGPLGGIHAALQQSITPMLVVPVDIPNIASAHLRFLIEHARKNQNDSKNIQDESFDVFAYQNSPLPFLIKSKQKHLDLLETILEDHNHSKAVKGFFDYLNVKYIETQLELGSYNRPGELPDNYTEEQLAKK